MSTDTQELPGNSLGTLVFLGARLVIQLRSPFSSTVSCACFPPAGPLRPSIPPESATPVPTDAANIHFTAAQKTGDPRGACGERVWPWDMLGWGWAGGRCADWQWGSPWGWSGEQEQLRSCYPDEGQCLRTEEGFSGTLAPSRDPPKPPSLAVTQHPCHPGVCVIGSGIKG